MITSVAAGDLIFVLNLFTICFDQEEGVDPVGPPRCEAE
jgi:hypothetical protein